MRGACSRATCSANGRFAGNEGCPMPMITLGGLEMHYEKQGQGEPVLLIHGLGSSTEDWEPQVAALEGSFQLITYDVRGHGRTGKPSGRYSMKQFAEDAAQ